MPDKSWTRLGSRIVSENRILRLREDRYRLDPEGLESDFVVIDVPDWVNVIAITPEREVVLIRQYRHGMRRVELEIPGGMVDAGEDPAVASLRELEEETGYTAPRARSLGAIAPNPALQNNLCHCFVAEDAHYTGRDAQERFERIEVVMTPLDAIPALIRSGKIAHSLVVASFGLLGVLAR